MVSPPYESVYVADGRASNAGLVLGPSAQAVQSSYQEAGLVLVEGFTDLPDHIAVELEFMKYLCDMEATARPEERSRWRSRQSSFLAEHLRRWVPAFAGSVARNTLSPYYASAAEILMEFLDSEEKRILPANEGRIR